MTERVAARRWRLAGFGGCFAIFACLVVYWQLRHAPGGTGTPAEAIAMPAKPLRPPASRPIAAVPPPEEGGDSATPTIPPAALAGRFDCRVVAGNGPASGLAATVLPDGDGARFAIVNAEGELHGGTLPFMPHHIRLGQRADGAVLAAFGDLRLNSKVFRAADSPEPVRFHMDGQLVFESPKAWRFDVARDASSFFLYELLPGAPQLIVRDLARGLEHRYDMGGDYLPATGYESDYALAYSTDQREIVFQPAYADAFGIGTHWFVPVDGGPLRDVRVGVDETTASGTAPALVVNDGSGSALFASSETGYFAIPAASGDSWRIVRRAFTYAPEPRADVVWQRDLPLRHFYGTMILSDDGAWLAVKSWDIKVLDASTGEVVFDYPVVGDKRAELRRLAPVLPPAATEADIGAISSVLFHGGSLVLRRHAGTGRALAGCATKPGEEYDGARYNECVANARRRGDYRTLIDLFDLSTIRPDSSPTARFEESADMPCGENGRVLGRLKGVGERLVFDVAAVGE